MFSYPPLTLDNAVVEQSAAEPASKEGHFEAVLNSLATGLVTFDAKLSIQYVNSGLAKALDIKPQVIARALTLLELFEASDALSGANAQRLLEFVLSAVTRFGEPSSLVLRSDEKAPRFYAVQVTPLDDGHWSASFEEVTSRRVAEANAIEEAMHDPLTGLPNRQLFEKRFIAALSNEQWTASSGTDTQDIVGPALLMVDLDRFKSVNDTLGHPVGDALLKLVAKRLRTVLRPTDVVARLGGDEFALLASPWPERCDLHSLATRIVDTLGRPYLVDGHLINIGASIGVALAPMHGVEHNRLLRSADLALYHAKQMGRGTYSFFEPVMDSRALARRALEIDLRKALPLREFELYYQPQIDLDTSTVVGFEALLRWKHPERGLVSPDDFIPIAEEIGLIVPLGEWVIQEACREAVTWPGEISVAVNISPHQFTDAARLVKVIAQSLKTSGLPGSRLEVEITESVLLRDETTVLDALHALRAMNVRVAMDDFGTGYSSLSQLHSFPFDKIKIDRSFVKDRGDVASQNAIIRAITALGVSLGMSTIAEGVETVDQLSRIRAEGCTSVQGYLFSKPVPASELSQFLTSFVAVHPIIDTQT